MSLPSQLLSTIAAKEGGRVVLIVGAGCSCEEPTRLPLSRKCSEIAYQQLIADGILNDGDCAEPWDLSALTDLVKSRCGGKQKELVRRLPITEFKNATPNEGHKIAAALMVEGAISNIVTLNFDLALNHALSAIGAGSDVLIINGPEQHDQLSRSNLVYLHRNVEGDFENLILTTDALDNAWADGWEEFVTRWAMAAPVTVFVGLGSSCGVLRHTAVRLRSVLGDKVKLILADPGEWSKSTFAKEMEIDDSDYVPLGWIALMRDLGDRFHREIVARIRDECDKLSRREGWMDEDLHPIEDIEGLSKQIEKMGFLSFGKVRSAWFLDPKEYPKLECGDFSSIADLLLIVGYVARRRDLSMRIDYDGYVAFASDNRPEIRIRLIDGSSKNYRWLTLETDLRRWDENQYFGRRNVRRVLACGVTGCKPARATPPESIIDAGSVEDSIIDGNSAYSLWDVNDIRRDDSLLMEMLA